MDGEREAWRLDRVALNVGDLDAAAQFYRGALGFSVVGGAVSDPGLAAVLGVRAVHTLLLHRGAQTLELCACDPSGAPIPAGGQSNDLVFQHCALATDDMASAHARLCRFAFTPISRHGPQTLPGGIVAYKFRDPDGHPLELIAFPQANPATAGGIDHSAICVADPDASIEFYAASLGLTMKTRQVNQGPAQDALDGIDGALVDVVALAPAIASPHVELLGYRRPIPCAVPIPKPSDRLASRLVFACMSSDAAEHEMRLMHDLDGHVLLLERGF